MAINLAGFLYSDNGTAINNAAITLVDSAGSTEDTTTTNSSGYWSFAEADEDIYDIKITQGSQIRYVKGLDKISLKEIDVRNNAAATNGSAGSLYVYMAWAYQPFHNLYGAQSNAR